MNRFWKALTVTLALATPAAAEPKSLFGEFLDPAGDASIRRTDPGADGPIPIGATLPDLLAVRVGRWTIRPGGAGPFDGSFSTSAPLHLVRIDVVFDGLVNPPGPLGVSAGYADPFRYGPSPIYGFIEFDLDDNRDTGGELGGAAYARYLANVGRFGQVVRGSLAGRMARTGAEVDQNFSTQPQIERSGADFALAFCGCFDIDVISSKRTGPVRFQPGDQWTLRGRFFQRAGGFEEASAAFGGSFFGLYDPEVDLLFAHDITTNRTTISLVYPLDMYGAALLRNEPEQAMDLDVSNHNSVAEAMDDVIAGSFKALSGPTVALVAPLQSQTPTAFIDPSRWRATALVGTTYAAPDPSGALYVWTDALGHHLQGDFNADGLITPADAELAFAWLAAHDGGPDDADGVVNGVFQIRNFGPNFCVYDTNGDGQVTADDFPPSASFLDGDADHNCAVDFADLACVLTHWSKVYPISIRDPQGDANHDRAVDFDDLTAVLAAWGRECRR